MLITTSRKPSNRTRAFCKSLNRVLISENINRGKMSMREVLLKASELNHDYIALVHEFQGNPSKITFIKKDGKEIISADISVSLPEQRLNIQKDELILKCDISEFGEFVNEITVLANVFNLKQDFDASSNFLLIKDAEKSKNKHSKNRNKYVMEFYNRQGNFTGFKIFIKGFQMGEDFN